MAYRVGRSYLMAPRLIFDFVIVGFDYFFLANTATEEVEEDVDRGRDVQIVRTVRGARLSA